MPARTSSTSTIVLAIAIVVAAVLAPVTAVAAGQLVEISSASGRKADVTRAEQLQTAEASPHQFVRAFGSSSGSCTTVMTAPATKAIIVKTLIVDVGTALDKGYVYWWVQSVGTPCTSGVVGVVTADRVGTTVLELEPGLIVPAGAQLQLDANPPVAASLAVYGYKIAPEAVPASTPAE